MVMLLTEMSLRETDCCALKHIKKTFNKTFKELQNEYPHDHLEGGGQKMRSYFQGGVGQLQSKCVQGGRGVKKGPKIAFIIKVRSLT